jgi:hypothetical protein
MSALPRPPLATLQEILGDWRSGEGRGASASPRFGSQRPEARRILQMSLDRLKSSEVSYETYKKLPARLRSLAATLWCC